MSADEDKNVFVSDQEILSLISAWKSQVGRNPTDDELARIINNLIDEEILYREALLLGLCLLYTSPSPRDGLLSRMPSSA